MTQDDADILGEYENAEFAAAAAALRERRTYAARRESEVHPKPQEGIDWSEPDIPYRPASIELPDLCSKLGITNHPKLAKRENYVFIDHSALLRISAHLSSNTSVELGGLLVGQPYYAPSVDGYLVVVHDGYAAVDGNETAVSFQYTSDTWQVMTPKLQQMPQDYVVVGSYHSHPGLGVFLSSVDIDTQAGVFSQPWQIALVIDPIRNETGFFVSPEGIPASYEDF